MRILTVAPEPFFSPRGTPFSVYYRALVQSELGVEIDLLTYGQGADVELEGVRIVRIPRFAFLGPVKVGPSLLKLFLDGFLLLWTIGLLVRRRYDAVHAHEESVFFCRFLKPLFRFKLVYDMHSSLPRQLVHFRFTRSRALIRLFEALEDSCLAAADAVLTISPALAEYARSRMPDPQRHILLENSIFDEVRLKHAGPVAESSARWEGRLPSEGPIIGYAGTFEPYQGLDLLVRAFASVRAARPDAFLLMIGGRVDQVEAIRELADDQGLTAGTLLTGALPQAETRELMTRADLVISPRREGENTPLKIYEIMARGTPLVATRISSHTQVLSEETCFLADPDPESLARAIVAALEDGEGCRRRAQAARELYDSRYSRAAYEGKMRALLEVLR